MHMFKIFCTCGNLFYFVSSLKFAHSISYLQICENVVWEAVGFQIHANCQHLTQFNLHLLQSFFSFAHFKIRENEIVGGGVGCQIIPTPWGVPQLVYCTFSRKTSKMYRCIFEVFRQFFGKNIISHV